MSISIDDLTAKLEQVQKALTECSSLVTSFQQLRAEYEKLTHKLHALQIHPDYEYRSRSFPFPDANPLETGWEPNIDISITDPDVTTRLSGAMTFQRRLKIHAAADFKLPQQGDPIPMAPLTYEELIEKLRSGINKGYMPSSSRDGYNSKPEYVYDPNRETETGLFAYDCSSFIPSAREPYRFPLPAEFGRGKDSNDVIFASIRVHTVQILVHLKTDQVIIRAFNQQDKPGPWVRWISGMSYPVDRFVFNEQLERL